MLTITMISGQTRKLCLAFLIGNLFSTLIFYFDQIHSNSFGEFQFKIAQNNNFDTNLLPKMGHEQLFSIMFPASFTLLLVNNCSI